MQLLVLQVVNGLILGMFYALMALGLSLILSLTRVINLAHGGFLVLGAYLALTISKYVGFWGALVLGPVLLALITVVVERFVIRPLYKRDPLESLLLTFGLALVIEQLVRMIWGSIGLPFRIPSVLATPLFPGTSFFFITKYRAFIIAVALIAGLLLYLFLTYTRLGLYIRAAVQDRETLGALGTNVTGLYTLSFALGVLIAGIAGVLAAGQLGLNPTMGNTLLLPSFIALVIGGLGSLIGSFIGGLLIGVVVAIAGQYFPEISQFAAFLVLAVMLLVRPRGLFGQEGFLE